MKPMTNLLYRTMSARTSRLSAAASRQADPVRMLLCWALLGVGLGAVLYGKAPQLAGAVWLTQGLSVSSAVRTLWDVYRTAVCPVLLLLTGIWLSGCAAFGQVSALLLLLSRGIAFGFSAAECFAAYPLRDGIVIVSVLILPFAYLSTLLLAYAVRDSMRLSNRMTAYLLRGNTDTEISEKQRKAMTHMLICLLLTLLAAGLHTLLLWLLNDRLLV